MFQITVHDDGTAIMELDGQVYESVQVEVSSCRLYSMGAIRVAVSVTAKVPDVEAIEERPVRVITLVE